ncbi:MAG: GNAT family N-acetyltransferase [Clostridia bacterium]|nr:GNAT family N-acetyltransferase [Clostridia bacterium]
MIEYFDITAYLEALPKLSKDAIGTEILSEIKLYGKESHKHGAFFWKQGEGLYLTMRNSCLRISGEAEDYDELNSFIDFIAPQYILTSEVISRKLNLPVSELGEILCKKSEGFKKNIINSFDVSVFELCEFFKNENMVENPESLLLDLSYANKENLLAYEALKRGSKIVAAAVAQRITDASAVISIVAVNKEYRREGLGTKVLSKLTDKLSGRNIYIFKEKDKNNEFYGKQGFLYKDNFVTIKRY